MRPRNDTTRRIIATSRDIWCFAGKSGRSEMGGFSRRDFGKLAGAARRGRVRFCRARSFCNRAGGGQSRDRRWRGGRSHCGPLREEGSAQSRRDADRGQPDLQLILFLQSLYRRVSHARIAESWLRGVAAARHQGGARLRHRHRSRQEDREDAGRSHLQLRSAGSLARHRHQVRLDQGLLARRRAHHAARL